MRTLTRALFEPFLTLHVISNWKCICFGWGMSPPFDVIRSAAKIYIVLYFVIVSWMACTVDYLFAWKTQVFTWEPRSMLSMSTEVLAMTFPPWFCYEAIDASSLWWFIVCLNLRRVKFQGRCCRNFRRILFGSFQTSSLSFSYLNNYLFLQVTPLKGLKFRGVTVLFLHSFGI